MLCLKCKTNSKWIENAKQNLIDVIIDHAHCEKKAAVTGMNLINNYPEKTDLAFEMADLIEEEIDHFRSVVKILDEKGETLREDKKDEYAQKLFGRLRKTQPERFLDHLLVAGIVEARSCERLQILADNLEDQKLKLFYTELAKSEAGHYMAFIKLAKKYFDEAEVKLRLDELTDIEAEIVKNLTNLPMMHG
ncbi:MAG: tRNA-(ms[2]io[6]A)-hydroxylase [Ignavibacteriae bacterium]|nr:tRNA-(ms[2]io[6]A)-hydroxylase [Ignavibacteriota bacterium]NOG98025.1 tRNA-(ms[2]io[6]A)-hydroxylase [Ignavibacteriota bacterium]